MCQIVRLDCQMQNELRCGAVCCIVAVCFIAPDTRVQVWYCASVQMCVIAQLWQCVLLCNCATVCYCALLCQMQQIFLPVRASTKFILDPVLLLQYLSMFIQPQLSPFKADLSKYL